jgi:hypothetical protein
VTEKPTTPAATIPLDPQVTIREAPQAVAPPSDGRAPGYMHAVHPDHGQEVVYTPGELLPDWAAAELRAGHFVQGKDGVYRLKGRATRQERQART